MKRGGLFHTMLMSSSASDAAARRSLMAPGTRGSLRSGCITSPMRKGRLHSSNRSFVPATWFWSRRREALASTKSSPCWRRTASRGPRSAKRNAVLPPLSAPEHDLRVQRLPVHHFSDGVGSAYRAGDLLHPGALAHRADAADQARAVHPRRRAEVASAEGRDSDD